MVAHQAVRMDLPIRLLADFGEGLKEILPVDIIQKNVLPPVSPAHNVVHRARILDAQLPRHGTNLPSLASHCQGK